MEYLEEKFNRRLAGWSTKHLSLAGRTTLVQYTLSTLANYSMQTAKIPRSTCDSLDRKTHRFLWGGNEDKKTVHLISWETLQKPKVAGGLGFVSARQSNAAFLTKLGWRVLSKPHKLWARVLRAKYCGGRCDINMFQPKPNMSNVWVGVSSQAKNIIDGATSAVGNGRHTLFWDHSWVEEGCLSDKAILTIPTTLRNATVSDMWSETSGWKWDQFANFLPKDELLKIAAYSLSDDPNLEDTLYWNGSINGKFSLKSALSIIRAAEVPPISNPVEWRLIWKLPVQQPIRMFVWLAAHDRLMCNYNRVRRGLADDPLCPRCHSADETTDHLLRLCPISRTFWNQLGGSAISNSFYSMTFPEWVSKNASNSFDSASTYWPMKFAITCWWLWRWRNNIVFGREDENPIQPFKFLYEQFEGTRSVFDKFSLFVPAPSSIRKEIHIRWSPPPHGWTLLSTDGATKGNSGPAGCDGIFRDSTGNFISAFYFSCGSCTSMRAELMALYVGLEQARTLRIDKLLIHMDNSTCVSFFQEDHLLSESLRPLVTRCKALIQNERWVVQIEHAYREANRASDWLANLGVSSSTAVTVLEAPPQD